MGHIVEIAMTRAVKIYVALLDEGIDVWRPIRAEHLGGNTYRILSQEYDRDIERWQFEPGDRVACELVNSNERRILAATRRADEHA